MKNLVTALIKAQTEFLPIKKDKENPFYHSKYADLENVKECTKKALHDNGLVVIQTFGVSEGKTTLWTYLYHTSGEFISGNQYLDVAGDPQKIASASTYARRYGLLAILGIAAEDDDGNVASKPKEAPKQADKPAEQAKTQTQASMDVAKPLVSDVVKGELCEKAILHKTKKDGTKYTIFEYTISSDGGETFDIYNSFEDAECEIGQHLAFTGITEGFGINKGKFSAKKVKLIASDSTEDIPF